MSAKKNDDKKTIVVVGGGSAGINIARSLSAQLDPANFKLILINPLPYRVPLPTTLRLVVSDADNLENTALISYDKVFHNGNGVFLQGSVDTIRQAERENKGTLVLKSGEEVPYDILALAPGSIWEGPIDFPDNDVEVKAHILNSRKSFAKATSVVVAGGGAVGIELAGEIKDIWPQKEVTVVHGGRELLNDVYPDKFRIGLKKSLQARGVKVITADFIDDVTTTKNVSNVVTRGGKTLTADLLVPTRGPRPNTAFIASLSPDVLTTTGFVKVRPTLQLLAYPNIFAAGDVIDWKEQKQAAKASGHGKLVAQNALSYIAGRPLKEYKSGVEMIAVTNGKSAGVSYFDVLWGVMLGAWFTRLVKSKTLLVPMFRKESGFV